MTKHGERRYMNDNEQFFHRSYGWIPAEEFLDLVPELESDIYQSDSEPDYLYKQGGESVEHYRERLRSDSAFDYD